MLLCFSSYLNLGIPKKLKKEIFENRNHQKMEE